MNGRLTRKVSTVLIIILLFFTQSAWSMDFLQWDALLKKYVAPSTIDGVDLNAVRYSELAKDPAFQQVVTSLESGLALKTENS